MDMWRAWRQSTWRRDLDAQASDTAASREERLRRMSAIFNHFDVHKRGRLDAHGFMQARRLSRPHVRLALSLARLALRAESLALRHMGRELSFVHKREKLFLNPDELSTLFHEADTDHSGYIDYDEFVASLEKFSEHCELIAEISPACSIASSICPCTFVLTIL
eukprot:4346574-Pleurochrysis_carterae.AAC.3